MSEVLKPCIFCKSDKKLRIMAKHYTDESHIWWVECARCGAQGMHSHEYERAIESWNAAWNARAELESEPPYDELLRCLENDWHIHASWDGLRRFWNIELTEEGVRLRDELNARAERTCEGTRWHELFGTPERAAQMLEESCHLLYGLKVDGWVSCAGCPVFAKDADVDDCSYSELLEWLRGEGEGE